MNASERNQKRIRKTRAIIVLLLLSMIFPIIWLILTLPNFLRDLHLRNSGIVATGTVVSIYSIGCGSDSDSGDFSYDVQFIDNHGQTWVYNISQCNNIIGDLSVGDTIALLYAPDDPTVIAVQDRFTSQFQLDQIEAVGGVVIFIGMILAILLTLLRYLLLVLRERGPSPGNWLLALASKNEAVASFIDRKLCRIGIHQGEWTKTGCQLKRYCMFCLNSPELNVQNFLFDTTTPIPF